MDLVRRARTRSPALPVLALSAALMLPSCGDGGSDANRSTVTAGHAGTNSTASSAGTSATTSATIRTSGPATCGPDSCALAPVMARLDDGRDIAELLSREPQRCDTGWMPGKRIEEAALHGVTVDFGRNVVNATLIIYGRSLDVDVSQSGPIVDIQREGGSEQRYIRRDGQMTNDAGMQTLTVKLYKNAGVIRVLRVTIGGIQEICAVRLEGTPVR